MDISDKIYNNEDAARKHLEASRWPNGACCAYCNAKKRISAVPYKIMEAKGWYYCGRCRKRFTVRVGTIMERSHIPLHKWLLATHLMCASKKGISAHQMHRMLRITYKTAWFMGHRIRESMKDSSAGPLGGGGGPVEIDETYHGKSAEQPATRTSGAPFLKRAGTHRRTIISLVERGGNSRSFHINRADKGTINRIIRENLVSGAKIYTDESRLYGDYENRESVHHARGEYVRGDVHTNSAEGFFGLFKKGMDGVYQHCSERHLQKYLTEFDFRWNNRSIDDAARADKAVRGMVGKRMMYRDS